MQITAVEAIPYAVPNRRPTRFASGAIERADNVLVRIHTDEGLVGQAEAQPRPYTYGETQKTIVATVTERLGPLLEGIDPLLTELAHDRCAGVVGNEVARGAVDLAIWDLAGKVLGQPCRVLLGGFAEDVAVAYMVSYDEPELMVADAVSVHEAYGVRDFKVKVGRTYELDVAAVRGVREALPDCRLYVDANRGWSFEDARRISAAIVAFDVLAIEEPISVEDRRGRLRLAEEWAVPLLGDESCISLARTARALDEGAVGMVSVKTARTGFTESRRILGLCQGRSVPVVVGSQYESAVGSLATAAFAAAFAETAGQPAELMNFIDLADDICAVPIDVRDGRFAPPSTPGIGIEIDEEKLTHYRLDDPVSGPDALARA